MKKKIFNIAIALFSLLLIMGCSKEDILSSSESGITEGVDINQEILADSSGIVIIPGLHIPYHVEPNPLIMGSASVAYVNVSTLSGEEVMPKVAKRTYISGYDYTKEVVYKINRLGVGKYQVAVILPAVTPPFARAGGVFELELEENRFPIGGNDKPRYDGKIKVIV